MPIESKTFIPVPDPARSESLPETTLQVLLERTIREKFSTLSDKELSGLLEDTRPEFSKENGELLSEITVALLDSERSAIFNLSYFVEGAHPEELRKILFCF